MSLTSNFDPLFKSTSEFREKSMETSYLQTTWQDNKKNTRNALLVIGFMFIVFFIRDLLEVSSNETVHVLLIFRIAVVCILFISALILHRATKYRDRFHLMLLGNQIMISIGIFVLAIVREMPIAYLGVNTILFTMLSYQFLTNRFLYTIITCVFVAVGALLTGIAYLNMDLSEFIASILFLVPLNYLGISIMRSINRTRRSGFLALNNLEQANGEKETAIKELQEALTEVKTLRNFLPICANCKKIRDDEGYWNQIEVYLKRHANVEFSHGLCPDCMEELYGDQEWYKKSKTKEKKDEI